MHSHHWVEAQQVALRGRPADAVVRALSRLREAVLQLRNTKHVVNTHLTQPFNSDADKLQTQFIVMEAALHHVHAPHAHATTKHTSHCCVRLSAGACRQ